MHFAQNVDVEKSSTGSKFFFLQLFFSFSFLSFQHTVALSVVPPCALVLLLLLLVVAALSCALSLAARELTSPRRRIRTYTYAAEGITSVSLGLWEAPKIEESTCCVYFSTFVHLKLCRNCCARGVCVSLTCNGNWSRSSVPKWALLCNGMCACVFIVVGLAVENCTFWHKCELFNEFCE